MHVLSRLVADLALLALPTSLVIQAHSNRFAGTRHAGVAPSLVLAAALFLPTFAASGEGTVVQVVAGYDHTCALLAGGGVKCWGDNSSGQLGDGTNVNRNKPVDVVGLSSGVSAIAAGYSHTCAATTAGAVKCWGDNWGRQLGDGTDLKYQRTTNRNTPVDVVGLSSGVTAIAAGYTHTCALTASGAMFCWGEGPGVDSATPAAVPGLSSGMVGIAAGYANSLAVGDDGRVRYWGLDGQQLVCSPGPVCIFQPVSFGTPRDAWFLPGGITAVSASIGRDAVYRFEYNLCAVAPGGRVMCWGGDFHSPGQLATAAELDEFSAGVTAISMGGDHSCVLASGGIARCWGWNDRGQLGNGTTSLRSENPTTVVGLPPGLTGIAAGGSHTCAVSANGELACWGENDKGQLGEGSMSYRTIPVRVIPPPVNYQGLWWNSPTNSEPGWGLNLAHQGDTIFASWFTYDVSGRGSWLVMTAQRSYFTYAGTFYQMHGPPFSAQPFDPNAVTSTAVGTGTLTFTDANNGTFHYALTNPAVAQTKSITREVFGSLPTCVWDGQPNLALATNYQDLWWAAPAASESGWGINLNHQGDTIFATWFTYDVEGSPMWLVVTAPKTGSAEYAGDLYRTSGARFDAFDPAEVVSVKVGTATFAFANGNSARFAYTISGVGPAVTQTKTITREILAGPGTTCQ